MLGDTTVPPSVLVYDEMVGGISGDRDDDGPCKMLWKNAAQSIYEARYKQALSRFKRQWKCVHSARSQFYADVELFLGFKIVGLVFRGKIAPLSFIARLCPLIHLYYQA